MSVQTITAPDRVSRVDVGGVPVTVTREMRLRHVSDTAADRGVVFGGDQMGHWNVDRINRILDALDAPVHQLRIPIEVMRNMARVGAPDAALAKRYAHAGLGGMPPLSFVSFEEPNLNAGGTVRTMLVDGHHRMLALAFLGASAVPARILPRELEHDVRVVEIAQVCMFPAEVKPTREVELGRIHA